MISARSRYTKAKVCRFIDRNGVLRKGIAVPWPAQLLVNFTEYRWQAGDRVDLVAAAFYDDPNAWHVIAQANPEIMVWDEVPIGYVIRVPYE